MANNSAIKSYTNVCDKPDCLGEGTPARVFFKGGVETTDQQPFINGTITALTQRGDGGWDATFTYDTATMPPDFIMVFPSGGVDGNVADPDCFGEGAWAWKVQQLNSALLTPALTGDISSVAGNTVTTLATVNSAPGPYGSETAIPVITVDGKGRVTASTEVPIVINSITDLGDGINLALSKDTGTEDAPVLFNRAGGTPSSLVLTNATGLPVSTGVAGLGATVAATLAIDIGNNAGILTKNAALGTPSSGTLSGCSGLPASGVTGTAAILGANTFTGAQTYSALTTHNAGVTIAAGQTLAVGVKMTVNTTGVGFFNVTPVAQQTGIAATTDSTGGTAGSSPYTYAAIAAGAGYTQADMLAVKNSLAKIAAQMNAIKTLLSAYGLQP